MNFIHFLLLASVATAFVTTPPLLNKNNNKSPLVAFSISAAASTKTPHRRRRHCHVVERTTFRTSASASPTSTSRIHLAGGSNDDDGVDNPVEEGVTTTPTTSISAAQQQQQQQQEFKQRSEAEWRKVLTPQQYYVLRQEGTERPWSSPLNDVKQDGVFVCAGCGSPLFTASKKFESGTGWPSFYDPLDADSIDLSVDYKLIVPRVEVSCKTCGGHLGHVFDDGPRPTGKRYCINGVAMDFVDYAKDPNIANLVSIREQQQGNNNGRAAGGETKVLIREPFMAIAPGLALDLIVAGLFLNVFFQSGDFGGGGGGGDSISSSMIGSTVSSTAIASIRVDQIVFQSVPLVIGIFYFVQALGKVKKLSL